MTPNPNPTPTPTVMLWGLPLAALRRTEAVEAVAALVRAGRPSYVITANTHYAMLTARHPDLHAANAAAAFVVADGKPLVWASRLHHTHLPERIAGSDLIYDLAEIAAREGFRLYFLGGPEGVADEAARRLQDRYPGLEVVGVESPPYRELTEAETEAMKQRVRAAAPDILIVSLSMPKGERWIHRHHGDLGVPLCINLGAGIDFVAGRVRRAPRWCQAVGMEWAYRTWQEPRRLLPRYAQNAWFLAGAVASDLARSAFGRRGKTSEPTRDP